MTQHTPTIALLALLGLALGCGAANGATNQAAWATEQPDVHPSLLYGRVTMVDGETYQGRLRFGGDEEAFWGDYFNGRKDENPWLVHLPKQEQPRQGVRLVGLRIGADAAAVQRPFMARMGDIAKLEARGRDLWVTMRNGTVHHLNRYAADDFADGVRVWDTTRGVVDLHERRIRTIEFEEPVRAGMEAPYRLHGTVHTPGGEFTGFIQWGREGSLALDELEGRNAEGDRITLPFATVRSITKVSGESARIMLLDGRGIVLSDSRHVGAGNRGIYVDDPRFGRVLVSWSALEHADFTPVGAAADDSGPAYRDFAPGQPLSGTVTTADGQRFSGRLVFDLDESEHTTTLDAPADGVDYTLPFGLVRTVLLPGGGAATGGRATVVLRNGETLQLERAGDLGRGNGGMLIFAGAEERAQYVPWRRVVRIDFRIP
jgi:hypothetical protein